MVGLPRQKGGSLGGGILMGLGIHSLKSSTSCRMFRSSRLEYANAAAQKKKYLKRVVKLSPIASYRGGACSSRPNAVPRIAVGWVRTTASGGNRAACSLRYGVRPAGTTRAP